MQSKRPAFGSVSAVPIVALVLSFATGCDGKLSSVEGQVLYQGQAAKGVIVIFHPADPKATRYSGVTDDTGKFVLASNDGTGAMPGKYKVTLTWPEEPKSAGPAAKPRGTDSSAPEPKDRLAGKYATTEKSTVEVEVKSGANRLDPIKIE